MVNGHTTTIEALQSTSLLRGKTAGLPTLRNWSGASIHFPLAREDDSRIWRSIPHQRFNPLPSCEGRRNEPEKVRAYCDASIHFPLAREDGNCGCNVGCGCCFNPLPSCEGRPNSDNMIEYRHRASIHFPLAREDKIGARLDIAGLVLQSTSLLRGKTFQGSTLFSQVKLQSTSLLRGKTKDRKHLGKTRGASIHFPLAREDLVSMLYSHRSDMLQSTSLLRGKTRWTDSETQCLNRFNPLPSCEGRHSVSGWCERKESFNPLPSCEGRPL